MPVSISIFLFGKPGQELEEGETITPEEIRGLARELSERLEEVAEMVGKLTDAGWDAQTLLYDIALTHPYISTPVEVESVLLDLGIDPDQVAILEWEDNDPIEPEEDDYLDPDEME